VHELFGIAKTHGKVRRPRDPGSLGRSV